MSDTGSDTSLPSSPGRSEPGDTTVGPPQTPPLPAYYPAAFAPAPASPLPPRPKVEVGSWLLMIGGGVLIVGSLLTWWTVDGFPVTGMDGDFGYDGGGPVLVLLGLALAGFGVAQLLVGRVRSVAIAGIAVGVVSLIFTLSEINQLDDLKSRLESEGRSMQIGTGPWVVLIGSSIALAGAIATLSRPRRWPTPVR